jgi:hypothetical protein
VTTRWPNCADSFVDIGAAIMTASATATSAVPASSGE